MPWDVRRFSAHKLCRSLDPSAVLDLLWSKLLKSIHLKSGRRQPFFTRREERRLVQTTVIRGCCVVRHVTFGGLLDRSGGERPESSERHFRSNQQLTRTVCANWSDRTKFWLQTKLRTKMNSFVFQQIPESWSSCHCGHVITETRTIAGKRFSGKVMPMWEVLQGNLGAGMLVKARNPNLN